MSTTLHARGLSAGHGERTLFSDLDLVLAPGDVIGLVGVNGAGKSTLLRMLADRDAPTGEITLSPPDATIGYLAQEPERVPGESVLAFLSRRTGVAAAQQTMDAAAERLAEGGDDEYSPALERWLALGGADLDQRAEEVAAELGLIATLPDGLATPMTALSGGQAARAGLASVLLSRFDILLLDEPTNDLDLDGLARLEQFVAGVRVPLMVISHDREFLARTVNRIVELDLAQQQVGVYDGGYESYLAEREIARRHARERYEEYADTRSALEERAVMQRNWMEHGVRTARRKARDPRKVDSDKAGRKMRAESTEKQASKVRQTQRRIERLEVVEEPRKEWELRMSIAAAPRSGSVVATVSGATVTRGEFTLGPVTAQVDWGDRIVLTGANGSGKSTLLALLLGKIAPDTGSAALGSGVAIGEVDQARGLFRGDTALADTFAAEVPDQPESEIRTLLAKFGLRGPHVLRPNDTLSPGERTRAALALLQARGVNLLVLDEPTNHLDLPAIEQLEQAVESFDGTMLLITHDRRMLDNVRATRRWRMDHGHLTED
ncbi:ABC-F family ATP-binding cassette domain-containing protein [Nocardia terpenica]|uniref:ABC-F family ATP-binding cassette domain-containing protein n=1 Tax=Nocardia terpenica TaxID=455432 RepID=UPI001895C4E0|nr:ABC-F family ATP-binding cassette domain-containing protein [Nocardia terpenica]MBF6061762.1 ABC-F family ATP-binding cassette domain-containing protein [Nocardia terpenica]MBF6106437.1 ABC-F family ATP-binding cassette domain-containing protein [Nocardia terpenica]MBF6110182.1 ABC-F family ATP-binding cassette domain-containing protein [Nocardia terpenica]MBF6120981.1 ABC-F family ATP-binding cassette domain-containing protein [Nocardia terpenica]MBF6151518.1 ABC-F family ATP-binding casse